MAVHLPPTVHTCMSAQGRSLLRDCHGNNRLLRCDDASRMLDGLIVFLGPDAAIVVGCCVASLFFSFFLNHPTFILSLKTTTVNTTIGAGHQGPACSLVLLRILEPVIYYAHSIGAPERVCLVTKEDVKCCTNGGRYIL